MSAAPPAPIGSPAAKATQIDGAQATTKPLMPKMNAEPKNHHEPTRRCAAVINAPHMLPMPVTANNQPNNRSSPKRWSASFSNETL